jgi:hypothetical protein
VNERDVICMRMPIFGGKGMHAAAHIQAKHRARGSKFAQLYLFLFFSSISFSSPIRLSTGERGEGGGDKKSGERRRKGKK